MEERCEQLDLPAACGDPIIGLGLMAAIIKIWDSWRTVSPTDPGEMVADGREPGGS